MSIPSNGDSVVLCDRSEVFAATRKTPPLLPESQPQRPSLLPVGSNRSASIPVAKLIPFLPAHETRLLERQAALCPRLYTLRAQALRQGLARRQSS